ncbi:hypothetical protein H6F76_24255 [Leptolyngbya sp. FACHB-321]|uniref:hypothetical protein n=1 Tax=Leptolyngbya sp. FACHB-321 TaxID=2692807 RepID=UPI0016878623|nr:hypothetical protein [Leptolyngbya sp. FACHB-321]MBD2038068.1 hypothetical protein [Leptolyngbya sp. FACHB-321]
MSSFRLWWRMDKASDRTKGLFKNVTVAALWWLASGSAIAVAAPADVFMPHLDRIRQNLPPNVVMRLPSQIRLSYPADEEFIQTLAVRISTSDSPPRITVGLFSCEDDSPFCRIGTFSAVNTAIAQAQQDYQKHMAAAAPIQLARTIRGYLLMGTAKQPPSEFSSIMWQQDGMFYTVSLANPERQNMLYMAVYMANEAPFTNNTALRKAPLKSAP